MVTLVNRAKVSTSSTGTGTITLGSAVSGYQSFADAGVTDGQVVRYVIEDGNNWEIGTGTYTASGTTLSRTPSESSNAGSAINLSGSATVYVSAAAEDIVATSGAALTGDLDFGDSVKATFGADEDLWIYHDGGSSYVYDRGTGNLRIITNSTVSIDGASGGEFMAQFVTNGAVSLYYDNSKKFETTSTGVSVTGNVSVTGTVDGRDVATDGTKLDGIEAGADVTDAANVEPLIDAHLNTSTATSGEVLSWTGTDYDWIAAGGGTALELYAENPSSPTAPSATGTNAVALQDGASASGNRGIAIGRDAVSSGNYSVAIGVYSDATPFYGLALGYNAQSASGNGATALTNSYASGTYSFAAAIANNTSSYGATGANSVAIGDRAKATGSRAFATGYASIASGNGAKAFGGFGSGTGTLASKEGSTAIGDGAKSEVSYKVAISTRSFAAQGDAQTGITTLRAQTTNATPIALYSDTNLPDTGNQVILPNNSAYAFSGTIIARQQASAGSNYAAWEIKGALLRDANAASTVLGNGIKNKLYASAGASAWDISLTADTTNGGLAITVTGAAATNIRWVATVNTSEVTY